MALLLSCCMSLHRSHSVPPFVTHNGTFPTFSKILREPGVNSSPYAAVISSNSSLLQLLSPIGSANSFLIAWFLISLPHKGPLLTGHAVRHSGTGHSCEITFAPGCLYSLDTCRHFIRSIRLLCSALLCPRVLPPAFPLPCNSGSQACCGRLFSSSLTYWCLPPVSIHSVSTPVILLVPPHSFDMADLTHWSQKSMNLLEFALEECEGLSTWGRPRTLNDSIDGGKLMSIKC